MKGGYQIVDLKGVNVGVTFKPVPGVYESIEGNYYKPLLLSGIVLDGTAYPDTFIEVTIVSGNYQTNVYGRTLVINDRSQVRYNPTNS